MSTLTTYITGYVLSIALTLAAFGIMEMHLSTQHAYPSHTLLAASFIVLALLQLLVQLFFFLHVGRGKDRQVNAVALGFTLFIIFVVVGGTLWVMHNLQHNQVQDTFLNGQINARYEND